MGKNTPERQTFIIDNLRIENDILVDVRLPDSCSYFESFLNAFPRYLVRSPAVNASDPRFLSSNITCKSVQINTKQAGLERGISLCF